jgi:hypothetical protein
MYSLDIPSTLVDVEGDGNCLFYCMLMRLVQTSVVPRVWVEEDPPVIWMRKRILEGVDALVEAD